MNICSCMFFCKLFFLFLCVVSSRWVADIRRIYCFVVDSLTFLFDCRLGRLVTTISSLFNTQHNTTASQKFILRALKKICSGEIKPVDLKQSLDSQIKIMIPTRNWCRSLCCNWGRHQQPQQNERSSEVFNILFPAQSSTDQVQKEDRWDQRKVNLFNHLHNIL